MANFLFEAFRDDVCILYENDFRDIIDNIQFDFIITDPPYNVNYKYPDFDDNLSSEKYIELLRPLKDHKIIMINYAESFCGDIRDSIGKPKRCVFWCYSSSLLRQSRMIAWYNCKPNFNLVKQSYKDTKDKRIIKAIEKGSTGCRIYDWWSDIQTVKNVSKEKCKSFTNQIPIKLLERIILLTTKPNDIILDPFFGSGSIYFACKNTGRKCIGIEKSNRHINCFFERLKKNDF